jgi:hypothetical protein
LKALKEKIIAPETVSMLIDPPTAPASLNSALRWQSLPSG